MNILSSTSLKQSVRKIARRHGYEISRFSDSPAATLTTWLRQIHIDTVIDIGAHAGEFCLSLRAAGFEGGFVSFEPGEQAFDALQANALKDRRWQTSRLAIADSNGTINLNISGNEGGSSSVLPMLNTHLHAAPTSRYVASQEVKCARLDTILPAFCPGHEAIFLKVDVQGFERAVLDGAQQTLQRAKGIHIELALTPLYEGQSLITETMQHLISCGFEPWAFFPTFSDPASNRMLQVDGVFFRP